MLVYIEFFILGFITLCLPFFIYFSLYKNGLSEMLYCTLLYNMEYTSFRPSFILNASGARLKDFGEMYFISWCIILCAILRILNRDNFYALIFFLTGIFEISFFLYNDGFNQYPLVCATQIVILLNEIVLSFQNEKTLIFVNLVCISFFLLLHSSVLSMIYSVDGYKTFSHYTNRGWEKLVNIIPDSEKHDFIAYGWDALKEIYLLNNLVPKYKFFAIQEWQGAVSKRISREIHDTFFYGDAKWLITDNREITIISDTINNRYELIDKEGNYSLYRLRDSF